MIYVRLTSAAVALAGVVALSACAQPPAPQPMASMPPAPPVGDLNPQTGSQQGPIDVNAGPRPSKSNVSTTGYQGAPDPSIARTNTTRQPLTGSQNGPYDPNARPQ